MMLFEKISEFVRKWLIFLALFFILLACSYSLLHSSFFKIHDFTHAARIAEMARSLDEGQFPVRWSENFGYGFGMPLFNFYAPFPYFIGALFYKLGFSLVTSIKLLYVLINFLTLVGAYLLGKKFSGRIGGVLLSAAFTLAPYRALNLFVRGSVSEAFAMAFLPFVLWSIISYCQKQNKKYLLFLSLSLVGIILTHNLTAMIFIPIAALFTFVYLWKIQGFKLLWTLASQFLLAFGLSAFYILPAFLEKDFTIINNIFSGYFHYSQHFIYLRQFLQDSWAYGGSGWGPQDDISFFLGLGQLSGLIILSVLISLSLWKRFNSTIKRTPFFIVIIFGLFFGFSLLMSTLKTKLLWDNVSLLQYIQFPWRFLSISSLFLAILVALNTSFINSFGRRVLFSFFLATLILTNARYFRPETYLENPEVLYYGDENRIQNNMSEILPDYIPLQMASEKVLKEANENLPDYWLSERVNEAVVVIHETGFEKLISTNFPEDKLLNFKIAYFPGWQAEIDGEKQEVLVSKDLGNIQVMVPSGGHKVTVYFSENTSARIIGNSISILSLLLLVYFFSPFLRTKQQIEYQTKS